VVMMTAYADVDNAIDSLNLGAAAYLRKPIDYPALLATLKDIEDKNQLSHKIDKERELLEKELRKSQHLGSLGLMAGGIAHDFNNLLTTILGYSELLLMDHQDDPVSEHVRNIQTAATRAKDLVKQILTFSRREEAEPLPMQLKPLVTETLGLLRPTLPNHIRIQRSLDTQAGNVMADPAQMTQVVVNLCINAIHAMEGVEQGVLEIGLDHCQLTQEEASGLGLACPETYVRLWVKDSGCGIDESIRKLIFKPFFTTKSTGKGTGLGLHMVDRIVRGMHGAINVDSEPGKGSTFTLYFPRLVAEPQPDLRPDQDLVGGQGHVLIVDDQREVVSLLQQAITRLGYMAIGETSSQKALEYAQNLQNKIDICVLDINMPELTGLRLCDEIRRARPDLPIVFISGSLPGDSENNALLCTPNSKFLQKPINLRELSQILKAFSHD
jgi:signal transduction histidine kinase